MSRSAKDPSRSGFTLIELLVVIAIIATLMALLLPAIQKVREAANKMLCGSNLRQLGIAVHNYHNDQNFLPPSRIHVDGEASWSVLILPYIEQQSLFQTWNMSVKYRDQPATFNHTAQIKLYYCPTRRSANQLSRLNVTDNRDGDKSGALGDYAVCLGDSWDDRELITATGAFIHAVGWPNWRPQLRIQDIRDGTSNTIFLGEKHIKPNMWGHRDDGDNSIYNGDLTETIGRLAKPTTSGSGNGALAYGLARFPEDTLDRERDKFGSYHNGGLVQFVFGDGVVRALSPATSTVTLGRLANRRDGLSVTLPD